MEENSQRLNQLLVKVVQCLHGETDSPDSMTMILAEICDSFSFGNAFIYECDHTKRFFLREFSVAAEHIVLPESFSPEAYLTPAYIAQVSETPVYYAEHSPNQTELERALCRLFHAYSIFIVFVMDDEGTVIACVGMTDRRHHFPLSDLEITMADSLLNLIADRARLRVYKQRLEYTRNTLESIMDHTGFDIYVNDYETHDMLYANHSMAAPYGGWENMRGKKCYEALYDDKDEECEYCPKKKLIDENGNPSKMYIWDYQRPFDQSWFRVISAAFHWVDGRLAHVISSSDITEAKKNELLIHRLAYYDTLTNLPNRRKLEQDFDLLAASPESKKQGLAVLFLDLNGFKQINDTYGHQTGDLVLQHIATLLLENPLTAGHSYRYGGDEFIFLYENMEETGAEARCQDILGILSAPFKQDDIIITCGASIGLSCCPKDGLELGKLIDNADRRMYDVKQVIRRT